MPAQRTSKLYFDTFAKVSKSYFLFSFCLKELYFLCLPCKESKTKKNHRFLNFPRKSEPIFPPDSGNSACEKQASNSPES
ncbi:MAG: hypothetical protein V4677_08105, partial [Bacteroidota bacterium]